jgi:hypothetical protein
VTDLAQNALGNFFSDVLTGSRSIGDALLDLVSNFASSLLQMVSQMAATGLFRWLGGLFGGGGGFSFGGLFGGGGVPDIFGGGATFSTMALPGFSRGGLVSGRGGKSSDSIFARLSDGEFVLNAAAVDYWGSDFLSSLNSRRLPDLGVEFGQSKGKSGTTIVNNVSVSSPDANSFKRSERQIGRMLSEYAQRS